MLDDKILFELELKTSASVSFNLYLAPVATSAGERIPRLIFKVH
jgi:hypothetical protein